MIPQTHFLPKTRTLLGSVVLCAAVFLGAMMLPSTQAKADSPIRLGFVGGVTGACAPLIDSELKGLELAVRQYNEAGGLNGRMVEIVVRDGRSTPDDSSRVARDLVVNENVDLLTGPCSSSVLLAVSGIAKEHEVLLYSTIAATQRANIDFGHPYIILMLANSMMEASALAEYATERPWNKIATIGLDYEWGHTTVETFSKRLVELKPEAEITGNFWPGFGETNFMSYIPAALAEEPDAILSVTFSDATLNLIQQGRGFGLLEQAELLTFLPVDSLKALGDELPEGVHGYLRAPFFALSEGGIDDFIAVYRDEYGGYPEDWAILAYDSFMHVMQAAEKAGTVESLALREALTDMTYEGFRGPITIRALDGQSNAPTYVGVTTRVPEHEFPIMRDVVVIPGDSVIQTEQQVMDMRKQAEQ